MFIFSLFKSFIIAQWRIILPVLIVLGAWWYVHHLLAQRDSAITALSNYKSAQTALANQQIADNAIKLSKGKTAVNFADQSATAQLTQLHLDRKYETDNLKALYNDKITNLEHNLANRLQSSPVDSASQATVIASDTEADTKGQSVSDTAIVRLQAQYDTLEKACIITTIDFNNLRAWGDTVCSIAVCE